MAIEIGGDMKRPTIRLLAALGALTLVVGACGGGDSDYPSEDFTWVVPYSEGGGFDTYSRGFADRCQRPSYQTVSISVSRI